MPVTSGQLAGRPPDLVPSHRLRSGSTTTGVFDTSSAVHSRSPCQLSPDGLQPAFSLNAHHPDHWTRAASGGLDPDPVARVRGACPHLWCSYATVKWPSRPPSAPSWRTIDSPYQEEAAASCLSLSRSVAGEAR